MTIKTIRLKKEIGLTKEWEREVKVAIILLSLFCAGMIIGAGLLRSENSTEEFVNLFNIFIRNRSKLKVHRIFLNSFVVNIIILAFNFLCGLNCIGMSFIFVVPIIRGLGYGMLAGFLINCYKISGIGYYLLTVFPVAVITIAIMVLSCCTSIISSYDIMTTALAKKQSDAKIIFSYLKKYVIYFTITVGAGLVDTIVSKSFSYLFEF